MMRRLSFQCANCGAEACPGDAACGDCGWNGLFANPVLTESEQLAEDLLFDEGPPMSLADAERLVTQYFGTPDDLGRETHSAIVEAFAAKMEPLQCHNVSTSLLLRNDSPPTMEATSDR